MYFSIVKVNSMVLYMIIGGVDDSTASGHFPAFTKFVLLRDNILSVELKLMKLRSLLADSWFWNSKALIRQAGEKFQVVMEEIFTMLCADIGNKPSISVDYCELKNPILLICTSPELSVKLTLNNDNLSIISEMFSSTKECVRDAISQELWTLFSLIIRKQ